jgi:hypothetical protein
VKHHFLVLREFPKNPLFSRYVASFGGMVRLPLESPMDNTMDNTPNDFLTHFDKSRFSGILRWQQLDDLWTAVRAKPEGWYASLVGETPPTEPMAAAAVPAFLAELDTLLRTEHDYDYCGVVYADDPAEPTMIKVFDPHNMGSSCGCSGERIMPRWVLSRLKPVALVDASPLPTGRKRWWQKLFG